MQKSRLLTIVSVIMLGMLFGCVSSQTQGVSGFLGEYPTFEKGPEGVEQRYLKDSVDFSKYTKIMMDEVIFYFDTQSDYNGIHPSEIQELSKKFHSIFVKALGDKLTDSPGPEVARMRLAVTDIEPSNPLTSTITTVTPMGIAVNLIKKGSGGEYTGVGSASVEVEILDSLTNERIAAGIDKAPGGKLDMGKLSPAESAFAYWAERISVFMNDVKNK